MRHSSIGRTNSASDNLGTYPKEFLLLNRLNSLGMDLFVLNLRGVPASAKGFDQVDRSDHLLAEELRCQPLIGQQS